MSAASLQRDTGARRHARYSPSTFASREKCPGWTPDNDPSKSTTAADRGTLIHAAIETEDSSTLTDAEDQRCADKCMLYVDRLADAAGPHQRFREMQLKVLDQFGMVDDLIVTKTAADMTDYKTGYRAVPDAEINAQVQGYVLGVFDHFEQIETVNVHLLMPRQDIVSTFTYTRRDHYKALKHRVFMTIESAKAVDQLFQQGETEKLLLALQPAPENCEYCGRKAACPALNKLALTIARRYDPALVIPEELHGHAITDPAVMAQALLYAPILEDWAKGIKKAALELRMDKGVEFPGWTLAERKGARKISDAQIAWDCVATILTPAEFAACADVSLPDLETAVAGKAPKGGKQAAKTNLENQLRDRSALKDASTVHYLKQIR